MPQRLSPAPSTVTFVSTSLGRTLPQTVPSPWNLLSNCDCPTEPHHKLIRRYPHPPPFGNYSHYRTSYVIFISSHYMSTPSQSLYSGFLRDPHPHLLLSSDSSPPRGRHQPNMLYRECSLHANRVYNVLNTQSIHVAITRAMYTSCFAQMCYIH